MNITLRNIGSEIVTISDLAIQLEPLSEVDLMAYQTRDLIASADLPVIMASGNVEIMINEKSASYPTMVARLTSLTAAEHNVLPTLKHNVSQDYFFETTKNATGQTELITYYTDSTKSLKIREEEVVRSGAGTVVEIVVREYDKDGNIVTTERQILNRGADGKVENIVVETT